MAIEMMQVIQKPVKGKKTEMVETELGTKISKAARDKWDESQGESLNEALIPGYAKKKLASMMAKKKLVAKRGIEKDEEE